MRTGKRLIALSTLSIFTSLLLAAEPVQGQNQYATTTTLVKGWNLIGLSVTQETDITNLLPIEADGAQIYMYDAASKGWSNTTMSKYGDEMKQSGSMRVKPLQGVWIYAPVRFELSLSNNAVNKSTDANLSSINVRNYGLRAFYGDYNSRNIYDINVDTMSLNTTIEVNGSGVDVTGPYGMDVVSDKFSTTQIGYSLNRKDTTMDVIDLTNGDKIITTINLPFKPRSTAHQNRHVKDYILVSGNNKPMMSLIDASTHAVVRSYGIDSETAVPLTEFGGSLATGHPDWLMDNNRFILIDRVNKTLNLYDKNSETVLYTLNTETAVHHVIHDNPMTGNLDQTTGNGTYFAIMEGSDTKGPGILKFTIDSNNTLTQTAIVHADKSEAVGAHHAGTLSPDGKYIYLPTHSGNVYVYDIATLTKVDKFSAGTGAGHISFLKHTQKAVITNHYDTFVTVVNTADATKNVVLGNVIVANADTTSTGQRLQAHTSGHSYDEKYFYSVASTDGIFFEIDMANLKVSRTLQLPGTYPGAYINMGSFLETK